MAMSFESLPFVIEGFSSFLSHAMAYSVDEPYKPMPFGVWAVMDTAMPLFLLPLLLVIFPPMGTVSMTILKLVNPHVLVYSEP